MRRDIVKNMKSFTEARFWPTYWSVPWCTFKKAKFAPTLKSQSSHLRRNMKIFCPEDSRIGPSSHHVHCTTLYYTALHCTTKHYTAFHCTTLHYTALHYTVLHCATLHYTALHCTTLHYTALRCTALYDYILTCTGLYRNASNAINIVN